MTAPVAVFFDLFATLAVEDFSSLVRLECELLGVSVEAFGAAQPLDPSRSQPDARCPMPDARFSSTFGRTWPLGGVDRPTY